MSNGKFGKDLTVGSVPRHLLSIATPMLLGNLINTSYSIVNAIWIGRILGKDAMGAIAVSFPIVFIFVAVASGATMATTILVSQFYGAKNFKEVEKTVGTSITLSITLGILLSIAGVFTSKAILQLIGTPQSIMPMAAPYLKISFVGFTIIFLSFLVTSILRGVGDTKNPLYFMIAGVIVNALLDPLLIIGIGPFPRLGLIGAALASIASSLIALILGIVYVNFKGHIIKINPMKLTFDKKYAWMITKIGFPSMLQQSAVSLGMAAVTSFVNRFGESATAAFGAGGRIDSIGFVPAMSIGMAVSTIVGQNLGSGKIERVKEVFRWGVILNVAISLFCTFFYLTIPNTLLSMFITDQTVIHLGADYLRIVGSSAILFAILFVANGVFNGAGHTMVTMVFTLIALWGVRVPCAAILSRTSLGLNGIWLSFTLGFAVSLMLSLYWYSTGRWKKTVIRHGTPTPDVTESVQEALVSDESQARSITGV